MHASTHAQGHISPPPSYARLPPHTRARAPTYLARLLQALAGHEHLSVHHMVLRGLPDLCSAAAHRSHAACMRGVKIKGGHRPASRGPHGTATQVAARRQKGRTHAQTVLSASPLLHTAARKEGRASQHEGPTYAHALVYRPTYVHAHKARPPHRRVLAAVREPCSCGQQSA